LHGNLSLFKLALFVLQFFAFIIISLLENSGDLLDVSVVNNLRDVPLSVHLFVFFLKGLSHKITIVVLDTPFAVDLLDCDMQAELLRTGL